MRGAQIGKKIKNLDVYFVFSSWEWQVNKWSNLYILYTYKRDFLSGQIIDVSDTSDWPSAGVGDKNVTLARIDHHQIQIENLFINDNK